MRALANRSVEIYWHHTIQSTDLHECRFSYKKLSSPLTDLEPSLHYSNKSGLVHLTKYKQNWETISNKDQCWGGITKHHAELTDSGNYTTTLFPKNGSALESPEIHLAIYQSKYNLLFK